MADILSAFFCKSPVCKSPNDARYLITVATHRFPVHENNAHMPVEIVQHKARAKLGGKPTVAPTASRIRLNHFHEAASSETRDEAYWTNLWNKYRLLIQLVMSCDDEVHPKGHMFIVKMTDKRLMSALTSIRNSHSPVSQEHTE